MRLGIAAIAVFSAVVISPTEGSFFKRRRGTWKDKNALAGEIAAGEIATGEREEKKKDGKSKDSYDPTKEQEKRDKQVKLKKKLTKKKGDSQPKVDKPKAESPPKEGYDEIPSTPKRVRILNSNSPGWHYSGRPAEEPDSTAQDTSE
ncbi:hypothetical protein FOZ60_005568 [Perkinsus olseni]|uniref:Uncharacterized protein n=1 Tax=Perkinsus olseni TaxID=32597 RepID=A0A7J6NQT5_PEROL|nr:hypothetical protein FOZ60_005568 [Perkinsus olseni]